MVPNGEVTGSGQALQELFGLRLVHLMVGSEGTQGITKIVCG